ncbi:hypothetical protein V6N11_052087 [Hibiscus sabdariffa]|uniref:Uncharacterized protein n=1 Tax=Hibiscus sabdariffa TaxID=183260 RepID=A0ABR2U9R0_9ROSI
MIYLSPRFGSPNDGPDEALLLLGRVVAGPERSWAWSRKACSTVAGFVTGRRAHANWTRTRDRVVTCSYPSRVAAGPGVQGPGFHLSPSLATVLFPVAFQIAPDLDLKGFSLHFKTWNNRGSGQIATFSGVFHSKKYSTGEIGVRSLADFCNCDALLILGQIFCENTFQG